MQQKSNIFLKTQIQKRKFGKQKGKKIGIKNADPKKP
jgi:hypothetical protein